MIRGLKMGIINIVKTIKEIHKTDLVLVRIGKFYHAYGKDSYILSYLFGYQLKTLEDVSMCGFSETGLNKVISNLEQKKINYLIVDRRNNYDVQEVFDNKNLNEYTKIFEKAKVYIKYKNRIDNIYNYMMNNIEKEDFKNLLNEMEKIINERRKV